MKGWECANVLDGLPAWFTLPQRWVKRYGQTAAGKRRALHAMTRWVGPPVPWMLALLALALVGAELHASPSRRVQTVEQLHAALQDTHLAPRVLVKGDQVRLYFTNFGPPVMFKADWNRSRIRTEGFSSHIATLKFDASPPPLPGPQDKWRDVKVLAFDEWKRFARAAIEPLVPAEPGHGIYLQFALADAVLFRDARGDVKAVPFAAAPPGMVSDRRLNRIEATATLASAVEANLRVAHPRATAFALVPPLDNKRLRLVLFDLTQRRVVELYAPRAGEDPRGGFGMGADLAGLVSFALFDHGLAILKNPVSSVGRLLNQVTQWPVSLLHPRLRTRATVIPAVTNAPGMELAAWEHWLDSHTRHARERGSVRLLINGEKFFPVFEDRLAKATRNIDIQICIFDRDDVAVEVADLLKQRSTNLAVRVLFDHTSTRASGNAPPATPLAAGFVPPGSISRYLRSGSHVQVRPILNPFLKFDHSKVLLIDGRFAYLGGMNFGREYRYEWHDLMAEIEGPVVASWQREFDKNWAHAGALGDLAYVNNVAFGKRPEVGVTNRSDFIDLRRIYTSTGQRQIRTAKLECIRRARNHVFVENPYLYNNAVIVALVEARLRGVDVRVILPAENDINGGQSSNLVTANYLLKHGVRVYFYPGMTHVKAMLADGWVCFGSANFNTLSLRLNQEADLATSDAAFAARFRQELFETDFDKSYELKAPVSVDWTDHLADSILDQF